MELFNPKKLNFDFAKLFPVALTLSVILTVLSILSIFYPGVNYGIDFRGGVEAHVSFKEAVDIGQVRGALEGTVKNLSMVAFENKEGGAPKEFLITAQGDSKTITDGLTAKYGPVGEKWSTTRMDVVGARVGGDLRQAALLSVIYTCLIIALYMYWRFDIRFAPGALACIFHDLTMATGFIVLTRIEFSTQIVAALLTLAGYSINDTVVVFDRIRELEHQKGKGMDKKALVNFALNSTLSRTLLTSGMTLAACAILFFLGGPTLRDFAAVLFFGIVVGTYSSAFVATPIYVWADGRFGKGTTGLRPSNAKS